MTRFYTLWTVLLALASSAATAQNTGKMPVAQTAPKVITLAVDPAPAPEPAFKHKFRPHLMDQTPGNAALIYHTAIQLYIEKAKPDDADKVADWLDLPPGKLPADAVREMLDRHLPALKQTRLASRRERCDWEYPIRVEAFDTLLPNLAHHRAVAKLVALQARLEIAQGRFDQAGDDLQTGFAMARHACDSPLLISDLVGYAIAKVMAQQVLAWVQAPKAPNLYWALSDLPAPFEDPRDALSGEEAMLYFAFPRLRHIDAKTDPQEFNRIIAEINRLGDAGPGAGQDWGQKLQATGLILTLYPGAKQQLIASGRAPKEVDAMPVQQVVLMAAHDEFVRLRDDMFKWFCLPYWQARTGLDEAQKQLEAAHTTRKGFPFTILVPSLSRAYYTTTQFDRDIAALRCIEAIRMYAAAHDGKLPSSLDAVTAVPLPINPLVGKLFDYQLAGDQATLTAVAPTGEPAKDEIRYVITIQKQ